MRVRSAPRSGDRGRFAGGPLATLLIAMAACSGPEVSPALRDAVRDLRGELPVFPGAEGFGTTTPAGRGGEVIRVTSLAESGPGSLRAALQTPGPRTIVFEVGGTITATEPLVIADPFVTVAGQTAPPPGITLTGTSLVIVTHDVLVQHLRVRAGDSPLGADPGGRDSLSITGAADGSNAVHHVVVDHCSLSWAIDEGASTWNPGVADISFRRSMMTENLSHSLHPKGEHSKGLLIGDHSKRVAVVGNLFAHNRMRSPILKGDVSAIVAGNVIYNPGCEAIHLDDPEGSGPTLATIAGNVMLKGRDTAYLLPLVDALANTKTSSEVGLFDNTADGNRIAHATFASGIFHALEDYASAPVRVEPLRIASSDAVAELVLADAGARPRERDAIDARVIAEVRSRGGRIIDSPRDVGGLPETAAVSRPLILPDNPNSDDDRDGYTNLEEWLHAQAAALEVRTQ